MHPLDTKPYDLQFRYRRCRDEKNLCCGRESSLWPSHYTDWAIRLSNFFCLYLKRINVLQATLCKHTSTCGWRCTSKPWRHKGGAVDGNHCPSFRSGRFTPGNIAPGTHWVDQRDGSDVLAKRNAVIEPWRPSVQPISSLTELFRSVQMLTVVTELTFMSSTLTQ
jgi:hypothetical protein